MKNLILYGIGNARYQYRVLRYYCIHASDRTRLRAVQFSKTFWKEKALRSSDEGGVRKGSSFLYFKKGHIAMDKFKEFLNSIGVLAEISAIFYKALVTSGLSEDVAITLTIKMIHEIAQITLEKKSEDEDAAE